MHSLQQEFGLPLGLIVIDTIAACAGYTKTGDENDNAVGQAIMNVLKTVAQTLDCFVLAVDHFGKNLEAGTRGAYSKESAGDLVLACLGEKELSGSVTNTRLAVRKHRGGRQGQEYPFTLRIVEAPEPDEDGEPDHHDGGGLAACSAWRACTVGTGSLAAMSPAGSADGRDCGSSASSRPLWPITAWNCRSRRTGRWCGWSIRRSFGSSSTPTRRQMAPQSRSGTSGTAIQSGARMGRGQAVDRHRGD